MNASIIVATYGDEDWRRRGDEAAEDATKQRPGGGIVRLHLSAAALEDGGSPLARARNLAAEGALGDWLCFLDADDRLEPGYLDAMAARLADTDDGEIGQGWGPGFLARSGLSLLVPAVRYHDRDPVIPDWHRSIYEVNCACIGTLIVREFFLELGGFGDEPIYEDWALWLRAIREGHAKLVPVPGAVYRAGTFGGDGRNIHSPTVAAGTYAAIRRTHRDVPANVWVAAKTPR